MKKLVIIPGGFHPPHQGHISLYNAARETFPSADVFVVASDDRSERPFPFEVKKKLARLAGIPAHRFIQVRSPFNPIEITDQYPADDTQLIFVKSLKNAKTGADPEGPFPAERDPRTGQLPLVTRGPNKGKPVSDKLQYYRRNGLAPMNQHIYLHYLPVKEFGGMTSASEIRAKWQKFHDAGDRDAKANMVHVLYPTTINNAALTDVIIGLIDAGMGLSNTASGNKKTMPEALGGGQASLLGTAVGGGAGGLNPSGTSQPNGAPRQPRANRAGFREARLINDPEQGILLRPEGGMGTWDETSLVSNLARKFTDMLTMIRSRDYRRLYQVMYQQGATESMIRALAELEAFQKQQGRRPLARGREIDIKDYVEEKSTD